MKGKIGLFGLLALSWLVCSAPVRAAPMLDFWAFNIDGSVSNGLLGDSMSPVTGSLDASGLGSLSLNVSGAGSHSVLAYFDFEFSETGNSFFNEYADIVGVLAAGQSWEIDDPSNGDIEANVIAGALDNLFLGNSGVFPIDVTGAPILGDPAFAIGWDFNLAINEVATIDWFLSSQDGAPGFFITQSDPASDETMYFWSTLSIRNVPPVPTIPEPGVLLLLGTGLLGLMAARRRTV